MSRFPSQAASLGRDILARSSDAGGLAVERQHSETLRISAPLQEVLGEAEGLAEPHRERSGCRPEHRRGTGTLRARRSSSFVEPRWPRNIRLRELAQRVIETGLDPMDA